MSSTPTSTNETVLIPTRYGLLNINMNNVTKVTASNFLMWSRQVHALLDGYDIAGFLDGSTVIPTPTITTDGAISANPEYALWKRQDRLIYSALLGAIIVTIQPILSTTTTSAQIWETLSETYAKPGRAHVKQVRQQLKTWTKGTMTIDAYLQGFTTVWLVTIWGTLRTNKKGTKRNKIKGMSENDCFSSKIMRNNFALLFSRKKRNDKE